MTTTLNISVEPALLAIIAASLKNCELGRLMRALTARVNGEDPTPLLNNSGLRLAFALLVPSVDESIERLATNRANGARGGRPRKSPESPTDVASPDAAAEQKTESKPTKKSKKEDLSPTPPIEEKNKKNISSSSSPAGARENHPSIVVPTHEQLQQQMLCEQPWLEQLCMSRQIAPDEMTRYVADFINYLRERDVTESLPNAKVHFVNQLPFIINKHKNRNNHDTQHTNTRQEFIADPVARRRSERESRRQEVCDAIAELAAQSRCPAPMPF